MFKPSRMIDLRPSEWRGKAQPGEPIFGSGAPDALAYAIGWILVSAVIYWFRH
ncbi:hypothetical protein IVB46_06010 [Bradyrhizobium sp. 61]|jgi:hypothetical protein|uniref:hypothetical protein n=1 Tax=Bradyrhizobium sp. 61 TaxID=2782679 RepID=UPI001FFB255B|nr:hypothetical protein [Bradyrhizobium sp. 61]MCK1274787.1 hypothetical protein [Bradyrhizobium sp. 61]